MRQLTPDLYVEDRHSLYPGFRGANWGYFCTPEGIVMIDTPMLPTDAHALVAEIASKGEVQFVINTHHHLDHTGGNFFFPGMVVAHEKAKDLFLIPITRLLKTEGEEKVVTLAVLENYFQRIQELDPPGVPLLSGYCLGEPRITFSDQLTFQLGGITFKLLYLPGHTAGDIGVYLPQVKILFAGDNFTHGVQPSLAQSLPLDWIASLEKMEALDLENVIPGHGRICRPEKIKEFRNFIQICIDRVSGAINQGWTPHEAADRLTFEDLCPAIHAGPWQQRQNVLRLWSQLGGKPPQGPP
jgi:cyclase